MKYIIIPNANNLFSPVRGFTLEITDEDILAIISGYSFLESSDEQEADEIPKKILKPINYNGKPLSYSNVTDKIFKMSRTERDFSISFKEEQNKVFIKDLLLMLGKGSVLKVWDDAQQRYVTLPTGSTEFNHFVTRVHNHISDINATSFSAYDYRPFFPLTRRTQLILACVGLGILTLALLTLGVLTAGMAAGVILPALGIVTQGFLFLIPTSINSFILGLVSFSGMLGIADKHQGEKFSFIPKFFNKISSNFLRGLGGVGLIAGGAWSLFTFPFLIPVLIPVPFLIPILVIISAVSVTTGGLLLDSLSNPFSNKSSQDSQSKLLEDTGLKDMNLLNEKTIEEESIKSLEDYPESFIDEADGKRKYNLSLFDEITSPNKVGVEFVKKEISLS